MIDTTDLHSPVIITSLFPPLSLSFTQTCPSSAATAKSGGAPIASRTAAASPAAASTPSTTVSATNSSSCLNSCSSPHLWTARCNDSWHSITPATCPAFRRWTTSRTAPSCPGTSTTVRAVCAVRCVISSNSQV